MTDSKLTRHFRVSNHFGIGLYFLEVPGWHVPKVVHFSSTAA